MFNFDHNLHYEDFNNKIREAKYNLLEALQTDEYLAGNREPILMYQIAQAQLFYLDLLFHPNIFKNKERDNI